MEERLFWIGTSLGIYAWATRYGQKSGKLDNRALTSLWHGVFLGLVGFVVTLVVMMSVESRVGYYSVAVGLLSPRELYASLFGALALGSYGALRAWHKGRDSAGREYFHTEDLEWAETLFSAILLAAVMMYFIVQAFKIPSGSMRSTLLEGDHLFVNKFIYGVRIPFTDKRILRFYPIERGDVVVFKFPTNDPQELHCGSIQYGKDFIKRVIGLPGDEIKVVDGVVFINGKELAPEPYAQYVDRTRQGSFQSPIPRDQYQKLWENHQLDREIGDVMRDTFGPVIVPPGNYMVMGDNRDRSCDSRFWGPVPDRDIKGKAWLVYWPLTRMGTVR